jgi:hypothetical protein
MRFANASRCWVALAVVLAFAGTQLTACSGHSLVKPSSAPTPDPPGAALRCDGYARPVLLTVLGAASGVLAGFVFKAAAEHEESNGSDVIIPFDAGRNAPPGIGVMLALSSIVELVVGGVWTYREHQCRELMTFEVPSTH